MNRSEYLIRAREFASRGTARPNAKLNADRVRLIRENRYGYTTKTWADIYKVHYRTIEKVLHYETWTHVED